MRSISKISIVTPCHNAQRFIEETVVSVLNQAAVRAGRVELEYLIVDGASTDATAEIVESLRAPQISVISEPDTGMYDALAKGLSRASGDVIAYINAGDYYHPYAFDAVIDIFEAPNISWLTGYSTIYNEKGVVTKVSAPFVYRRRLLKCGAYGTYLPHVQLESTFWRRELLESVDMKTLARLKLAGDAYLWNCFSRAAELHIAETQLGGFRKHRGQLSENADAYQAEASSFARAPTLVDRMIAHHDRVLWQAPTRVKKLMNAKHFLCYDHLSGNWK